MKWVEDAVKALNELNVPHDFYKNALMDAFALLSTLQPGEVILIVGPSRVGKTRLALALMRLFLGKNRDLPPGQIPIIYLIAKNNSTGGSFSTKSFKRRLLRELKHPCFVFGDSLSDDDFELMRRFRVFTEETMDEAFSFALRHRGTRVLITDESAHIKYLQHAKDKAEKVLDSWKCSAQDSKYVLVLIGDYGLPSLVRNSVHLLGRSCTVHLPRYRWDILEEKVAFHKILDACSKVVPLPPDVKSLRDWDELLYKGSLGCIGNLMNLLRVALARALALNASYLERSHVDYAYRGDKDLASLADAIVRGEADFRRPPAAPTPKATTETRKQPKANQQKPFRTKAQRFPTGRPEGVPS